MSLDKKVNERLDQYWKSLLAKRRNVLILSFQLYS